MLVSCLLASCGAGSAALVSAAGGGGTTNTPTSISSDTFVATGVKASPVQIEFVLIDPDLDRVDMRLEFKAEGAADFSPMALVEGDGIPATTSGLETSRQGFRHLRLWDSASQLEVALARNVTIRLRLVNGATTLDAAEETLPFVGDEPPHAEPTNIEVDAGGEASGNVDIGVLLSDSSSDLVRVRAEFLDPDAAPDAPEDERWRVARPAGTPAQDPTPAYFALNLRALESGSATTFVWDSVFDLQNRSTTQRLRFRAEDELRPGEFLAGSFRESGDFVVDNNATPVGTLNNEQWLLNSDERRVLSVPFQVVDPEADRVQAVLQWRRPSQSFDAPELSLPTDRAQLEVALADPDRRRVLQICSESPARFEGILGALPSGVDPLRHLRLPELGGTAARLLGFGPLQRSVQILRSDAIESPTRWQTSLLQPVAVLPLASGACALALDRSGPGWTLAQLELRSGALQATLASGAGEPTALALSTDESVAVVASIVGSRWQLVAVDVVHANVIASTDGAALDARGIRGLLVLAADRVLATLEDALVDVSLDSPPTVAPWLAGLATPWGLARSPLDPDLAYLSESGADRVLEIGLRTRGKSSLPAQWASSAGPCDPPPVAGPAFPTPRALAIEGSTLYVVCEPVTGAGEVRTLALRTTVGLAGSSASPLVRALAAPALDPFATLGLGAAGLRVIASPLADRPMLGGGVQQEVELAAASAPAPVVYDPTTQVVTLDEDLDPIPDPGTPWRIDTRFGLFPSDSGAPRSSVFSWDTRDVPGGGAVNLRVTPVDDDVGVRSDGLGSKSVRSPFENDPVLIDDVTLLGPPPHEDLLTGVRAVALGDVDGDGDLDLATANETTHSWAIVSQEPNRGWSLFWKQLDGFFISGPTDVICGDFNNDGKQDFAGAIRDTGVLSFWIQTPPSFSLVFACPEFPNCSNLPNSLHVADFDQDGNLDLASAEEFSDRVRVTYTSPNTQGLIDVDHSDLGSFALTQSPRGLDVADFDRDGALDLVCASYGGSYLTILYSTGPRSYRIEKQTSFVGNPVAVIAADLDLDGNVDLVSANQSGSDLTVLLERDGAFVPTLLGPDSTDDPSALVWADLDLDGDLDLACTQGSNIRIYSQLSKGVFDPTPSTLTLNGALLSDLACGDLEGDGDLDLVAADGVGNRVAIFHANSSISEPKNWNAGPTLVASDAVADSNQSVAVGDLNGDAHLDLVSVEAAKDRLTLWQQTQPEVFERAPVALGGLDLPVATVPSDIDGDGDLDLVTASRLQSQIAIHFQASPGIFGPDPERVGGAATTGGVDAVVAADFDDDGGIDLASSNFSARTITVFLRQPGGTYSTPVQTLPLNGAPQRLVASDLDGDGRLELVTNLPSANQVMVLRSTAPGHFDPQANGALVSASPSPSSLALVDLDADGQAEILCANRSSWSSFSQAAGGQFCTQPDLELPLPSGQNSIAAADFDDDGLPDVATLNSSPLAAYPLLLFRSVSRGFFESGSAILLQLPPFGLDSPPTDLRAIDLDGDRDMDLLVSTNKDLRVLYGRH